MVYKKYIKIRGKKFGPYWYESYKEKGKVKTRYFGKVEKEKTKFKKAVFILLAFAFPVLLALSFVFFINTNKSNPQTSNQDSSVIVNRTAEAETYYLGNGNYKTIIHAKPVNIFDEETKTYKPFTEVVKLYSENDKLIIKKGKETLNLIPYVVVNEEKVYLKNAEKRFNLKSEFEIIIGITKAEHLDENRSFVSGIYEEVKSKDELWSEAIKHDEYVRVKFEQKLTKERDITVYARNTQQENTTIEVYEAGRNKSIAEFPLILEEKYYKIYLTNLEGEQDTFDLKVNNIDNNSEAYLEFDYIADPLVQLDSLNTTDDLEVGDFSDYWVYIIRFNISGLSSGINIDDAQFCVYINAVTGAPTNDSRMSRINNQTWDETYSATNEADLPLTNGSDVNITSVDVSTWGCLNATNIIQTDYAEGNSFTSIFFALLSAIASDWDKSADEVTGKVGDYVLGSTYLTINHRENTENQSYLNITYSDVGNPGLTIETPANRSYNTASIDFNVSANEDLSYCNFTLNDWTDYYNMTDFNATYFNYTNDSLADGQYTAKFVCNDTADNLNDTETITFAVDTIYPAVTINAPEAKTYTESNISINITLNEAGYCEYSLDTGTNNNTMETNADLTSFNSTNISIADGSYNLSAYCNDTANNLNYTETRDFSIDIPPTITIVYPENTTYNLDVSELNYTYTETNPDSCWYSTDNGTTNSTLVVMEVNFTSVSSSEGSNNWTLYCNDSASSEATASVVFVKDTATFDLANISAAAGSYSATITWDSGELSNSTVYYGTTTETTSSLSNTSLVTSHSISITGLSALTLYYYNVSSCDVASNCNISEQYSFATTSSPGSGGGTRSVVSGTESKKAEEKCKDVCEEGKIEKECESKIRVKERKCEYKGECLAWGLWEYVSCKQGETCYYGKCISCKENWKCDWSECKKESQENGENKEEKYYSYPENCLELNNCGFETSKPKKIECKQDKKTQELVPIVVDEKGIEKKVCLPKWSCKEWDKCIADYTLSDIIRGKTVFEGIQERACRDKNRCQAGAREKRKCILRIPVEVKKVKKCMEEYVEIYEKETGKLVSSIKQTKADTYGIEVMQTNINFIISDVSYCEYCYDKVKNYDEEEVDCGGSCNACEQNITKIILTSNLTSKNIIEDGEIIYLHEEQTYLRADIGTAIISREEVREDVGIYNQLRGYIEFDISSIPDEAIIIDVGLNVSLDFREHVGARIKPMKFRPSTNKNQDLWKEVGDRAEYNHWNRSACIIYTNCWVYSELGPNAETDLQKQLSSDWFALGFFPDDLGESIIESSESENAPQLAVTYTTTYAAIPRELRKANKILSSGLVEN